MTLASKEGYGRQGAQRGHVGEAEGAKASMCVYLCVCGWVCVWHAGCGCPVKLNGACRVPNEPVLAGRLTHSDLPLCTSLSHLGCQRMAVNPSVPWTLAFTKPIHIFNKGLAWRTHMSQYVGLPLFLSCLVKPELNRFVTRKAIVLLWAQVNGRSLAVWNVPIVLEQYSLLAASEHKVM